MEDVVIEILRMMREQDESNGQDSNDNNAAKHDND